MNNMESVQLYHRIYGENIDAEQKKPALFLHGLMGYAANWGKIWPFIAQERQVIVVDQRGHGRSPKPTSGYSPAHYGQDILALLDSLSLSQVHIVGHSMGGRVANYFASTFGNRVSSVVFEDSGMQARPDRLDWIRNLLGSIPTPFANKAAAKSFFDSRFAKDPLVGGFLFANLIADDSGQYDWRFYKQGMIDTIETGRAQDAMELYQSIQKRILIVRGSRSEEFKQDEAEAMESANDHAVLRTIENAGHFVHVEQPTEFSEAIARFFAAND